MKKNNMFRNGLFYLLILLLVMGIISWASGGTNDAQTSVISSTEFVKEIEDGNVESFTIQPSAGVYRIRGEYKEPQVPENNEENSNLNFLTGQTGETKLFQTTILQNDPSVQEVYNALETTDTEMTPVAEEQPSSFWLILTSILPFLLFIGLLYLMMGQGGQGGQGGGRGVMNFGKSTAKLTDPSEPSVTFEDVAGAEEEKAELVEIVEFLKDPKKFTNLGATIPSGVLLEGPPGTGKTLLAKAVAGEAGVPFYSISGSEFVEMFVGVGAARVRDLFVEAKKNSPAIIFIDEIDAVGRKRGSGQGGGNDEREQTLNQLLVEMDGFSGKEGVIVIAATNRADVLDQALLRPGRFDRRILVGMPDVKEREAILRVHAKNKPLSPEVDLKQVAKTTPGFSGADLENLLNEAALVAARRDSTVIEPFDVDEASDRVIAGPAKRDRVVSENERRRVAYHEAGHTIIGLVLSDARTVHKVTIVPRGRAGGYAIMMPREDRYLLTTKDLYEQIVGLLGGRAAEEHFFDSKSTGASNDFEQATNIARQMVTTYGMSDNIGVVQYESDSQDQTMFTKPYSEQLAYEIDIEIRAILDKALDEAGQIISDHEDQLTVIAEKLLEVETLNEKEILSLFHTGEMPEDEEKEEFPREEDVLKAQGQAGKSYEKIREEAEEYSKKREARYSDKQADDQAEDPKPEEENDESSEEQAEGRNANAVQDHQRSSDSDEEI